ncbi:MAG: hypothetical protein V1759_04515 [bacterium]
MPKYECPDCHRKFLYWFIPKFCPYCRGKLKEINSDDQKKPDKRKQRKDIKKRNN